MINLDDTTSWIFTTADQLKRGDLFCTLAPDTIYRVITIVPGQGYALVRLDFVVEFRKDIIFDLDDFLHPDPITFLMPANSQVKILKAGQREYIDEYSHVMITATLFDKPINALIRQGDAYCLYRDLENIKRKNDVSTNL